MLPMSISLLSTDGGMTYPITLVANTPNDGTENITVPNHISSTSRVKVEAADNIFYDISNANFSIEGGGGDAEPPSAPGNLSATNITPTSAELSWTASTDNVGVTGYNIRTDGSLKDTITGTSYMLENLTAGTSYDVSVTARDAANNESVASHVHVTTTPIPGCSGGINSFPYNEGWESGIGAWVQDGTDNLDWIINSNGTHSNSTGPASAIEGMYYVYVEGIFIMEREYPNKTAILTSPCIDLSTESSAGFSFAYHMDGASMGSLVVEASTDGSSWTTLWSKSGSQGISWHNSSVDLSAYAGSTVTLRFVGTTGDNFTSDMAVDKLHISTDTVTCIDVTLHLTLDSYPAETSWAISSDSGTTITSGGPYTTQSGVITEVSCLQSGSYEFTIYDSYGDGICCTYGNGSYRVTDASGQELASGGAFVGPSEVKNFSVGQ